MQAQQLIMPSSFINVNVKSTLLIGIVALVFLLTSA